MQNVSRINLLNHLIGDAGMAALTRLVSENKVPKLAKVWLDDNPASEASKRALEEAVTSLSNGELWRCESEYANWTGVARA
eukprot:2630989-Prymnesium_polylepis.1